MGLTVEDEGKSIWASIFKEFHTTVERETGQKLKAVRADNGGEYRGQLEEQIFAPVVKMASIRMVLSIATSMDLEVEQLDVMTTFLHGDLEEKIYMHQPEGFVKNGKENLVCRLKKSQYGLKQAPRQWYRKFDSFMTDHGYHKMQADHCVFVKKFDGGDFLILLLYVDDMLIVGRDAKKIKSLKKPLSKSFAMKDIVPTKRILGMHIVRDQTRKLLWLS